MNRIDMSYVTPPSPMGGSPLIDPRAYLPEIESLVPFYLSKGIDYINGFLSSFKGLRRLLAEEFFLSSSIQYHAAKRALSEINSPIKTINR